MLPVLVLAAVLVLTGCGGGNDSSDTAASGTSASSEAEGDSAKQGKGADEEGKQSKSDAKQGSNAPQSEGEPEPGITPQQRKKATTASVTLESPAFKSGTALPAKYTCDGGNVSPPLKWSGLPPEAAELVLFVLNFQPVDEALFFDWAVAGIDPATEGIEEGKLPPGAVVGKNSFGKRGYSLCPPEAGKSETYAFLLFAIPEALEPEAGFDSLTLREEVLAQHGNAGIITGTYQRR